jgi:uncharacterized metal-binding protein
MIVNEKCSCSCGDGPKLIFPCSGGSDVGEIADQASRKLTREGIGRMYCLAGIGGRVSGIMASTESASKILVIDGCPLNCAKRTLEEAGFSDFVHLQLAEIGLKKGHSLVSNENIDNAAREATLRLNADADRRSNDGKK